jgi:hypothetical protein
LFDEVSFKIEFFVGEIEPRFALGAQMIDSVPEVIEPGAEGTCELAFGEVHGAFAAGVYQIGDGFRLSEVEFAVDEGSEGELSGFSHAAAG